MVTGGIAEAVARAARDLTAEQNAALRPLVRKALELVGSQVALERAIGWDQSAISGFLSGRQGTSFQVALQICAMVDADFFEVLGIKKPPNVPPPGERAPDPTVGTFLLKLGRLPGLRDWVDEHPSAVTVSELLRGIRAYEEGAQSYARASDGQPKEGWGAFFDDLRAGRLDRATSQVNTSPGEAAKLEAEQTRGMRRGPVKVPGPGTKSRKRRGKAD